ncbi:MAG TPA: type II secretion system protein GspM [Sphingopyxis sp.]|nr:type II secretion system protein GspM [Sphingopyxis sp.]
MQLLAQRPAKSVAAAVDAVAVDQYLAQSAGEIGLTLDRNEARGQRQATIAIGAAKAPVLTGWLASLEGQGFIVDQLTITPAADGTVGMTAELRKAGQ